MVLKSDGGMGKAQKIVEAVIKGLGIDPEENRVSTAAGSLAWNLSRGSAEVLVALNPDKPGLPGRLRLVSPMVEVSADPDPALFRRLLELNGSVLPGVAFGLVGNKVVLVAERSLRGIGRGEVEELLAAVGHHADEYDDLLVNDFGGVRVWDKG
jgi:hypothetical protein